MENKELVNDLVTNGKRKVQERDSCDAECLAYIDIVQKILAQKWKMPMLYFQILNIPMICDILVRSAPFVHALEFLQTYRKTEP